MAWWMYPTLVVAGVGGGITGSVAGLASIVSYPVLLAIGLPPVSANVSNTVALVFSGVGSIWGSKVELAGRIRRLRPLILTSLGGGIVGSVLLLTAPASSFEFAVPWLIAAGSAAILLPRRARAYEGRRSHPPGLTAGVALIAIYSGYFGAAAGVLLLALWLTATHDGFAHSTAVRNLLGSFSNGVAAITFIFFGPIRWLAVVPLAFGFLIGGRLGPAIVRKTPPAPLRIAVAISGMGLAIVLGYQAYR